MPSQLDLYNTKNFKEVFADQNAFVTGYTTCALYNTNDLTANDWTTCLQRTWYLLNARYANSPISGFTEDQWKQRLNVVIFQYAPNWFRKWKAQYTIRNLTQDDIMKGAVGIYNSAGGDATSSISTTDTKQSTFINNQSVALNTKDPLRAYDDLFSILDDSFTTEYLNRFNDLFLKVVLPQNPVYFEDEV